MNAELGELDLLRELARRLGEAPHGGKAALVEGAARVLGCSRQEIYRRLQEKIGYQTGRKRRRDRGRISVSEETAKKAATLVKAAIRKNGKKTMPITVACEILVENGEELSVSPSTLSRAMRRYGCHPAQLVQGKPCTELRSLHPNHVWQVDASNCVLFYLPKGGLQVMDEAKFYKNKPANLAKIEQERVWRYVITDHYSGTIYLRYVQQPGESAQALTDIFLAAIQRRGKDDPMHGVPFGLGMDAGSANTSHLFMNLLERLQVESFVHMPGNSRAKGQVECTQNIVETQFEGRLAFYKVNSLEELQAAADRWRLHYNAWKTHSRTGRSRNEVWLTIKEDQLRLAPCLELCRELVTTQPKEVKVGLGMTISHSVKGHGRNDYDVRYLPGLVPGCKVKVVVNPYRAPAVDVILVDARGDESAWTVEPIQRDEAGFRADAPVIGQEHKTLPDTVADKHIKDIEAEVGEGRANGVAPFGLDVFADVKDAPTYIPKRGRDLGLDASRREAAPLSIVEAARMLKDRLGEAWNGAEHYAWLVQRYQDAVPADELDTIAASLTGPAKLKAAPLRVVAGGK